MVQNFLIARFKSLQILGWLHFAGACITELICLPSVVGLKPAEKRTCAAAWGDFVHWDVLRILAVLSEGFRDMGWISCWIFHMTHVTKGFLVS